MGQKFEPPSHIGASPESPHAHPAPCPETTVPEGLSVRKNVITLLEILIDRHSEAAIKMAPPDLLQDCFRAMV